MSLNVSHLDIEGPVCSSRAVVDAESMDNAFDEEKGFFLHPPGIAQQPHAAPWFALAAPEMLSFGVQWIVWGWSGDALLTMHAVREGRDTTGRPDQSVPGSPPPLLHSRPAPDPCPHPTSPGSAGHWAPRCSSPRGSLPQDQIQSWSVAEVSVTEMGKKTIKDSSGELQRGENILVLKTSHGGAGGIRERLQSTVGMLRLASPSQRWPGAAARGAGPGGQPGGLCLPPASQAVPSRAVYSVVRPPFCNRESVLVNVGDRNVITESLMKLNHFASKRTGRGSVSLAAGMAERILKADW